MATASVSPEEANEAVEQELAMLKGKILWALEVFPFISKSMIHQALGTGLSRGLWGPILDKLVNDGEIQCVTVYAKTPQNRNQSYILYHLPTRQYQPTHDDISFTPAGATASQAA